MNGKIKKGKKIVKSPVTGNKYKVTKWRELENGKIVALEKEAIE